MRSWNARVGSPPWWWRRPGTIAPRYGSASSRGFRQPRGDAVEERRPPLVPARARARGFSGHGAGGLGLGDRRSGARRPRLRAPGLPRGPRRASASPPGPTASGGRARLLRPEHPWGPFVLYHQPVISNEPTVRRAIDADAEAIAALFTAEGSPAGT